MLILIVPNNQPIEYLIQFYKMFFFVLIIIHVLADCLINFIKSNICSAVAPYLSTSSVHDQVLMKPGAMLKQFCLSA